MYKIVIHFCSIVYLAILSGFISYIAVYENIYFICDTVLLISCFDDMNYNS